MKWINKFKQVFRWNICESLLYHGILLGHQALLLRCVNYTLYGLIGTIFSLVYLLVSIINVGLDNTLGAYFRKISTNKYAFWRTLGMQLIPQALILATLSYGAIAASSWLPLSWYTLNQQTHGLIIICAILIFFESARKIIRTVLQLAFLHRKTTPIEIITICAYTSMVWIGYHVYGKIDLYIIFLPMLIVSVVSTSVLGWHLWQWHKKLPEANSNNLPIRFQDDIAFFKTRFFTFANQLTQTFFSSNMLVPLFALQFGLHHAGIFKFISTIAYSITAIMHKIFGHTSDVLMSDAKEMSLETKRSVFYAITNKLHQVLYGIIIFLAINIKKLMLIKGVSDNDVSWILVYLFFIINITENFLITYERFYITEEKPNYLFIINAASIAFVYPILHLTNFAYPLLTLLWVAVLRGIVFLCISVISFYTWHIKPAWKPQPLYTVCSLIFSLLFFLFVK